MNEVQQQTQTKIDVDFDTDPCKCYIKVAALVHVASKWEDGIRNKAKDKGVSET